MLTAMASTFIPYPPRVPMFQIHRALAAVHISALNSVIFLLMGLLLFFI